MKAGKFDITIEQGAGFELPMAFTADDAEVDLSGCTARLHARATVGAPERLITLTTENGGIVLGGTAGTIVLKMTAVATSALHFKRAVYDLEIKPSASEPYRLLEGNVYLDREVTR